MEDPPGTIARPRELVRSSDDEKRRQVGNLLFWNNCSTRHRAVPDYKLPQRRLMERTTVRGSAPF